MKNKYEIRGDVTAIFIKRRDGTNLEVLIDTDDLHIIQKFPNSFFSRKDKGTYYAEGWIYNKNGGKTLYLMHRMIMNTQVGLIVDHINHNGLDNRRANLRNITNAQNNQNKRGVVTTNKSGMHGVYWHKQSNKWICTLTVDKKALYFGKYTDLEEAKEVMKKAIAKYHPYSKLARDLYIDIKEKLLNTPDDLYRNNKSGYRGVSWNKSKNKWTAYICKNKKMIQLGCYSDVLEAAKAVEEAIR